MEADTEEILLDKCRKLIEDKLGWEDGSRWSTHDFETLGNKIQESTGVNLSIATLKRIWGKIRYDSKPTPTTLNTLARYIGYGDWREFRKKHQLNGHVALSAGMRPRRYILLTVASAVLAVTGVVAWLQLKGNTEYNPTQFKFSSKKIVDQGVPNSVVFDYDASAASPSDSIQIQQSWDKRLTTSVSRTQVQHTSIYYYPGFFEAKLVVNGRTMLEHDLLITTNGWMAAIDQPRVPVYVDAGTFHANGTIQISEKTVSDNNVPLQPQTPIVSFHYFKSFEASSNDLVMETAVKNDYGKGSGVCQFAEIRIQFEGPAVLIPLSSPGCVSDLGFSGLSGKEHDLSAFGRNMSEWVHVRCVLKENKGEVFVDGNSAGRFLIPGATSGFVGIGYWFQGPASVDFVRVTEQSGKVIFEDNF